MNPSAAPVSIIQQTVYVAILGLFKSTENYSRTISTSSRLGVKNIVKTNAIFVVYLGCTVSNLPSYTNAEAVIATDGDIYNVGDVVEFACNDNFATNEAFLGCTCSEGTTINGASWECNSQSITDACQPVSSTGKYHTTNDISSDFRII